MLSKSLDVVNEVFLFGRFAVLDCIRDVHSIRLFLQETFGPRHILDGLCMNLSKNIICSPTVCVKTSVCVSMGNIDQ